MRNQLLLLQDVDDVGRSGDIVNVKPGFARNFLLPQKLAVIASPYTLRMQEKLKAERAKQAEVDRKDSEELAKRLDGLVITHIVKVDPDGHMYGSVAVMDVVRILETQEIKIERRNVVLPQPIKTLGAHPIHLKLKEGVPALITIQVMSEEQIQQEKEMGTPQE